MEQKNRISVRINGKQRSTERDNQETAATKEEKDFHWVLPKENHSGQNVVPMKQSPKAPEWGKKKKKTTGQAPKLPLHRKKKFRKTKARKRKKQPSVQKKQWVSAFSAIVVGVLMGMIVLSIFTDHHHVKTTDGGNSKVTAHNPTEAASGTSTGSSQPVMASNLDLSLQIVQGAAFSTRASGQTAADTLKNEGFAGVVNQANGKFHLFIGVGMNKKNTDTLGNIYKQHNQDVYVKTFSIQVNGDQLKPEVSRFLGEAKPVMTKLMKASVQGLTSGTAVLSEKDWNSVEEQMKQLNKDVTAKTKPVLNALNTAVTDIGIYRSNPNSSSLWKSQQALLEAMLGYQKAAQ